MGLAREQICRTAAGKLTAALSSLHSLSATIGLDGFVDEIASVVDTRLSAGEYRALGTIDEFGRKVSGAAGQSTNFEVVVKQTKIGGNGPIMAGALASLGMDVTCVGSLGYPKVHEVFEELGRRAKLVGIAPPGHTTALEFSDGKLMLGKLQGLSDVTWENLETRVGREKLIELFSPSRLIGVVNWTMIADMSRIWSELASGIFPKLAKKRRTLMVDLADPGKRTRGDLLAALIILSRLQEQFDVVLGMNLKESNIVAGALGLPAGLEEGEKSDDPALEKAAAEIRKKLGIGCVAIHPRKGAAGATKDGSAVMEGPFVQHPKISTGAGDHFNAGFCLARVLDFSLEESLCMGLGTSGYYVRHGTSPGGGELAGFLERMPGGEK
jgi:sugar/nucleoside kinase (ribokinase family)